MRNPQPCHAVRPGYNPPCRAYLGFETLIWCRAEHPKKKANEMTSITYIPIREHGFLARVIAGAKSFGAKIIAARQAQAERLVNAHLATLDDATLARMGVDRKTVDKAQKGFYPYY